ncbi:TetR family transcriptional regulator [Alkalibaculum sp. M08DMB]|uniref:TetR family transcriptional regulator n=1 Tax=Alkalibaculum sporogenes TaxID=2655001 RepID=A0A6A7KA42_9FIRM|nr:TetR/AcrR family transcriptional regulator [Alkalibaculum sporogenes]MPW26350.1 TetR family transcriptional regulator [Alkalibaculum sporogenes]
MAEYKTSKISKNKIIDTCKELFYLQGYKKTTYVDICNKANSNPGLINYYFKTKKNIAGLIYGDFFVHIKDAVKKYMLETYNCYDLQYGTTLELRVFTYLLDNNPMLKNFYYDICNEGIEYDIEVVYHFYKLHVDEYNLNLSEDEIKLIQTAVVGSGIGITKRNVEGFFNCDTSVIFNFRIKSMFSLMGVTPERVNEILSETEKMFSKMEIELNDYFLVTVK